MTIEALLDTASILIDTARHDRPHRPIWHELADTWQADYFAHTAVYADAAPELVTAFRQLVAAKQWAAGPVVLLPLNPYQASNLIWLLRRCWTVGTKPAGTSFNPTNSGDWCGEIPIALEPLMKVAGDLFTKHRTNNDCDPMAVPQWDPTGVYIWDDGKPVIHPER